MPPGLTIDPNTGIISGTPAVAGLYGIWVNLSDSTGNVSPPQNFLITIASPPMVTPGALLNGVVNTPYAATLAATGGTLPYANWKVTRGTLPSGLLLDPVAGIISGNPISNGYSTFGVTVQDADGISSAEQLFSIAVGLVLTTTSLPNWTLGAPYSVQLTAAGGTPPYASWAVSSSTLPPGLTLDPLTGLLSGFPTSTGGYSFAITVTDAASLVSTPQPFTVTINKQGTITTTSLAPGVVTVPYSAGLILSGGTPPSTWSITSGSLPAGLSLFATTGVISGIPKTATVNPINVTVQATDAAGVIATQQLSIGVNQASLLVAPAGLTFNIKTDDPTSLAAQNISVFSNSGPVAFSASASTTTGGNWLSVSGPGTTPGNLSVSVTTGSLAQNTIYNGQITITGPTLPKAVIVLVTLNIASPAPAQLSVWPGSLTLDYAEGYAVEQRYFLVTNSGSGTLNYTVKADTSSCGSWLNLLNGAGASSATGKLPGYVAVQVSPAGLSDQTCTGKITVTTTGQSQTVPVTMTVSGKPQSVLLSRTAVLFQAAYGGTAPSAQNFAVLNAGSGSIDWTVDAQTMSGGSWLSVTPATGTAATGNLPVPVNVSANPQGLDPGDYYGSVGVTAPGAGNGPQSVTVKLTVASQTPAQVAPTGVILVGQASTGTSEVETLSLNNPGMNPLSYTSTIVTDNHGSWLTQKPATGSVAPGSSASLSLQANIIGLAAGTQHGVVRIAFADGSIHTVDVYLIVPGTNTPSCYSNALVAVFQSPEQNFQAVARTPVPVQLQVKDCYTGKLVKRSNGLSAQVLIGPQNTSAIQLTDDGTGTWTGTWTPVAAAAQVSLTAMVANYTSSTSAVASGQSTISGSVNAAPADAPAAVSRVLNGVSSLFPSVVAPGSTVSLRGDGMSMTPASASVTGTALPTNLGGTQVLLQGQPLSLSYVDAQRVDAVIPPDVTANERQQLFVVRGGTLSAGVDVQVASPQSVPQQ